ncbi:MAG: 50S ribosomal protein L24 [archaeon]
MKKEFSKAWNSSSKARKQRKYRYNAPLHLKRKFLSSNLSKELRKKYSRRNIELRKGDAVRVMRGELKAKRGKITGFDSAKNRVYVEGIQKSKKDGTKVNISFDPSKLQIVELNIEDKKRIKKIERKIKEQKK